MTTDNWRDGRDDLTWRGTRLLVDGRYDDPDEVRKHAGQYMGSSALVILGGPSAQSIPKLDDYDLVISCNGAIQLYAEISDYWLCLENFAADFDMPGFDLPIKGHKVVNFKIWHRLLDKSGSFCVHRIRKPNCWNPRRYGHGLLKGPAMQRTEHLKIAEQPIGTVAAQAIHWAALLGVDRLDTIGLDLCLKDGVQHGYPYPRTEPDNPYWHPSMWTSAHGLDTSWFWIETAEYMRYVDRALRKHGIVWRDLSNGLLQAMGVLGD